MTTEPHPASECPSCGRFVGPYGRCPYCGADVGQRMVVRIFKYGSLVLAIGGLAVLLFAAGGAKVPVVEIGDLEGTMNWAYVRIEGVVTRQPSYDPSAGNLRIWLWDGTGEILAIAYRSEAERLLAEGLVPVMGDRVVLEGTLRIKDDFQYLVLDVPQNTEIQAAVPAQKRIAEIDLDLRYEIVTVRGVIRGDRIPYEGLRILTLRDDTGQIEVAIPTGDSVLLGDLPILSEGQLVQVTGAVDQYKGTPQISLGRDSDLVVLDGAIALAPQRRLGELSAQDVGDMALVEATIVRVDPFSAGVKFRLDDGTGLVTLLVWQELYESLTGRDALVAGTRVRILGEVAEYRGDLEIVPQIASDLAVLGSSGRDVERRALGELSEDDTGRTVAVQGILCSLQAFSAGVKGTLDDDTGTATLLLWQDLYEGLSDGSRLVPGAILEVQGEVNLYRGELEIVPQSPKNVTVVGLAELPSDRRAIEQVTSADVDQVIELVGRITGAVPFSKGIRYTLDDGTGTVTLLLWHDVYEQLADEALLSVGAEVGVHGKVAEYLGQLEIVPQMPGDIRVAAPVAGSTAQETPEAVASPAESPVATVTPGGKPPVVMTGTPTAGPTMGTPEVPPQPSPPPTPLPTATLPFETKDLWSITDDDIGRSLTVAKAGIVDVDYFSQGVKYRLEDGKGSIILLLWQNVLEEFSGRYDLVLGSQLQVTGRIDQFAGDLELVPRGGADIILLARGERLPLEERLARNVTASDEGRIFTVEGTVTRVEGSGWIKVWLADSTGEILIFVPERTVPYLPAGIGHGVRLRATGAVDIYQGTVEIIPLAGADVKVEGP